MLAGIAYCGHCGSKLTLTTSGKYRKRADGTIKETNRIRYACYGKTRKQTDCDGQTGYTMHILDDIIDKIVRDIFSKMKGVSKNDLVMTRYADELEQRKMRLTVLKSDYAKEADNLNILKSEVVKCIRGESKFSQEMLSGLITESEAECSRLLSLCEAAEKEVDDSESVLKDLSATFDKLVSWAELYDDAEFAQKKMIVNCLIRRIDVYRDYKLKIDFQQFVSEN